jgi:ribosome-binding ATPase
MKIGLIGLPGAGKTSIFNALSRQEAAISSFSGHRAEPNLAAIQVDDARVDKLSAMYQPKKTIHAVVDLVDFVGLSAGAAKGGLFSAATMNLLKSADAFAVVVRNFHDELADEVLGPVNPLRDLDTVLTELLLSDLVIAERRIESIEHDLKRGKKSATTPAEEKVLRKLAEAMNAGTWVAAADLTEDDRRLIQGYQFLTAKPVLAVLNSDEASYAKSAEALAGIERRLRCVEFSGKFEMELSRMSDEDAAVFMADAGISESARHRLTRGAYELLGYISFFTVGEDEVRAWTLRKGQSAVDAAGAIHSDLARGFIRAECFSYEDLMSAGSEKGVRDAGKHRLEGKTYVVKDGDIVHVRFSI